MLYLEQKSSNLCKNKARQFIKSELTKRDINYVRLSKLMNDKGYKENPDKIRREALSLLLFYLKFVIL